jgi:hypothetical protein
MAPEIKIEKSSNGLPSFTLYPVKQAIAERIRAIIQNQWMDSDDYKLKQKCSPFLQGYEERGDQSWVFIEFWQNNGIQEFVDHVKKEIASC